MNKLYTVLWIVWLVLFCAIEGAAIIRKAPGDTLTEHIRKWMALGKKDKWLGRITLAMFLAWLVFHFMVPQP